MKQEKKKVACCCWVVTHTCHFSFLSYSVSMATKQYYIFRNYIFFSLGILKKHDFQKNKIYYKRRKGYI